MLLNRTLRAMSRAEIREMDKLIRNANSEYPRISPWRVADRAANLSVGQKQVECINNAGSIVDSIRNQTKFFQFFDMIFNCTKVMKKTKLGDCAESAGLTMCALLANGYTDGKIAHLLFDAKAVDLTSGKVVGKKLIDTTHEFVVRHLSKNANSAQPETYGKNILVLDAWSGFCGNLQEAFKHYFDTFLHGMRVWEQKENNIKIVYKPRFQFLDLGNGADSKVVECFRENFPELVLKK